MQIHQSGSDFILIPSIPILDASGGWLAHQADQLSVAGVNPCSCTEACPCSCLCRRCGNVPGLE